MARRARILVAVQMTVALLIVGLAVLPAAAAPAWLQIGPRVVTDGFYGGQTQSCTCRHTGPNQEPCSAVTGRTCNKTYNQGCYSAVIDPDNRYCVQSGSPSCECLGDAANCKPSQCHGCTGTPCI